MSHFSADMGAAHLHWCNASWTRCTYARAAPHRITFNIQSVSSCRAPTPHLQYYRLSSFCTWGIMLAGGANVRWRRAHRAPFLSLHLCAVWVQMHFIISLLVVIFVVQNMNIWVCCHRESSCRLSFTHPHLHSHTQTPPFIGCCLAPKLFVGSLILFQRELVEYIKNLKKKYDFLSRSGIWPPPRKKEDRQTDLCNVIFMCVPKSEICRQSPSVFSSVKRV